MARHKHGRNLFAALLKYVIPLVISVGLCWLLFTGVDIGKMLDIIRDECDFRWIAAAMGLSMFSYLFRALRWRIQLEALGIRPPLFYLVLSMFGTYAVNLVFPRLGEVWRSGYVAQREEAPFTAVFGSMVAERLADTVTVALITLLAFALASETIMTYLGGNRALLEAVGGMLRSPWLWIAVVAIVALLSWLVKSRTLGGPLGRLRELLRGLWRGFAVVVTMHGKGMWLLWTVCLWGCYAAQMLVAFFAFPSTSSVVHGYGLSAVLVTFAVSSISMGVPSNGGIGPWQWAVIFSLGIYGVDSTSAGAFANVVLGSQTVLQIILGIFTFVMIALDRRRHRTADEATAKDTTTKQQENSI